MSDAKPLIDWGNTERGFGKGEFKDYYDAECSIQESSLASRAAIWFGVSDAKPKIMVPGEGWKDVPLPDGAYVGSRMHLTQEQVRELLPILQRFAETGELGPA